MTSISRFAAGTFALALLAGPALAAGEPAAKPAAQPPAPPSLLTPAPAPAPTPATALSPTSIVAKVGTVNITQAEVTKEVDRVLANFGDRVPPEQKGQFIASIQSQILDQLIGKQLLIQAAAERKVTAEQKDVDEALKSLTQALPEGKTLTDMLKDQGVSREEFDREFKSAVAIRKMLDAETAKIVDPPEADLKKEYEANKEQFSMPETASARHVLVRIPDGAGDDVKKEKKARAEQALKKLNDGAKFEDVVKEYSEDPGSIANGGLYSDIPRGRMVKPFEDAVFSQEPGKVGPIVETQFGFHIIRVDSRKPARVVPFEEAKKYIVAKMTGEKKNECVREFMENLRSKTKIEVLVPMAPAGE